MKHRSTLFLKIAIACMALAVLTLCSVLIIPAIIASEVGYYTPLLIVMCLSALPFFYALYQALKILRYIDKNEAFSILSVKALKEIKVCAISIAALYSGAMPYIYYAANRDDAPGVIVIGLVVIFGSLVVAGFAAVLQLVLGSAIAIKTENDLTV